MNMDTVTADISTCMPTAQRTIMTTAHDHDQNIHRDLDPAHESTGKHMHYHLHEDGTAHQHVHDHDHGHAHRTIMTTIMVTATHMMRRPITASARQARMRPA